MIFHVNDLIVCVRVFVHPDGEVSVDSLSPSHTLSSVPSPASVEALSPSSLHVRICPQSFALPQLSAFEFGFPMQIVVQLNRLQAFPYLTISESTVEQRIISFSSRCGLNIDGWNNS